MSLFHPSFCFIQPPFILFVILSNFCFRFPSQMSLHLSLYLACLQSLIEQLLLTVWLLSPKPLHKLETPCKASPQRSLTAYEICGQFVHLYSNTAFQKKKKKKDCLNPLYLPSLYNLSQGLLFLLP